MQRDWRRRWFPCALAALGLAGGFVLAEEDDPHAGDPLGLIVEIGDQRIETFEGETFTVELAGRKVPVRVTAKPTKRFHRSGVSFEYPRHMSFEFDDADPEVDIWILDGNDTTLMVMAYRTPAGVDSQAEAISRYLVQNYGPSNAERSGVTIVLGGKRLTGHRVEARLAGERLVQDVYDLPGSGSPKVLMIMHSPRMDGSQSDEMRRTLELLKATLRVD